MARGTCRRPQQRLPWRVSSMRLFGHENAVTGSVTRGLIGELAGTSGPEVFASFLTISMAALKIPLERYALSFQFFETIIVYEPSIDVSAGNCGRAGAASTIWGLPWLSSTGEECILVQVVTSFASRYPADALCHVMQATLHRFVGMVHDVCIHVIMVGSLISKDQDFAVSPGGSL
ncbi:hypothetical protein LZ30DRAFT_689485 [Colletotrichum cereale]|nr:hypothetical protein LZ30DRAFT_689485 [Colletotrichum cereale]